MDSVQLAILVQCPACGSSTPINGLTTSVLCSHCANVFRLEEQHWLRLIGDLVRSDLRMARGETDDTEVLAPWGTFIVDHGHCDPLCPQCDKGLPPSDWQNPTGPIHCPACAEKVSVRPVPDWYAQANPAARWLVSETFEVAAEPQTEQVPISIHCINCGASLGIDGSSRTVVCEHCDSDNYLPDQLWLRLHPASVRKPWNILLDTGPTGYMLPEDIQDFCDVAHAPDGGLIAAFIEDEPYVEDDDDDDDDDETEGPIMARIVKIDKQGLVSWLRTDLRFDEYARLLCTPSGDKLVLLPTERQGLICLDPTTGETLSRFDCPDTEDEPRDQPPQDLRPLRLYNAEGVALAPNGTLVVLRNGDADDDPVFTRYSLDGQPLPMWPPDPEPEPTPESEPEDEPSGGGLGGFFRGLFGGRGPEEEDQAEPPKIQVADWDDMPERVLVPPRQVCFTFSPGGDLILASHDRSRLAHYDREGRLVESRTLEGLPEALNWCEIGADEFEQVYLSYEPPDYWMSGGGMHLIRLPLGGQPEILRGWKVDPSCQLGDSESQMKVRADGTLYLGCSCSNLRVVSPEGKYIYRSTATLELDDVDRQRYEENNQAQGKEK